MEEGAGRRRDDEEEELSHGHVVVNGHRLHGHRLQIMVVVRNCLHDFVGAVAK